MKPLWIMGILAFYLMSLSFAAEKISLVGTLIKKGKYYSIQTTYNQAPRIIQLVCKNPKVCDVISSSNSQDELLVSGLFVKNKDDVFNVQEAKKVDLKPKKFNETKEADVLSKGIEMGVLQGVKIDTKIPF